MVYNPIFRRTSNFVSGFVYFVNVARVDIGTYEDLWQAHLRGTQEELVFLTTRATYRDHSPGAHYEIGRWYQEGSYTQESHMRTMWLHILENAVRADDFPIEDHGNGSWSSVAEVWLPRDKFMELERYINEPSTVDDIIFGVE